jgi:hypothetical protein
MGSIPLDLQRRFEQRWAARFLQPAPITRQRHFERLDPEAEAPPDPAQKQPCQADRLQIRCPPAAG